MDGSAQFTLMPSSYKGVEPICISGVTGSQVLTALEAEISLTGNEWQKHPIVTSPEVPGILDINYSGEGVSKTRSGIGGFPPHFTLEIFLS